MESIINRPTTEGEKKKSKKKKVFDSDPRPDQVMRLKKLYFLTGLDVQDAWKPPTQDPPPPPPPPVHEVMK